VTPDDFLVDLFGNAPDILQEIITAQAAALHNPPQTALELLQNLSIHAPKFCRQMQTMLLASP